MTTSGSSSSPAFRTLCRARAGTERGVLQSASGHQFPQPRHRCSCSKPWPHVLDPMAALGPLHPAMLARSHCSRPRRHGRDPSPMAASARSPASRSSIRLICHHTLAVMATDRPLRNLGRLALLRSGCPARAASAAASSPVSPGKGGLGTFAPLLDGAGNSFKGQLATKYLLRTARHGPVRFPALLPVQVRLTRHEFDLPKDQTD